MREARLAWYGHKKLKMELKRIRPKRRFMDMVREYMQVVGATEGDAEETQRKRWKRMIHCGDP